MTRYKLKDKKRQTQLDALSDERKFSDQLQIECADKLSNASTLIAVPFGAVINGWAEFVVRILKSEIEIVEDLKPGVWYPKWMFDGNPNGYLLIETYINSDFYASHKEEHIHSLIDDTSHFMYIERPEVSNG